MYQVIEGAGTDDQKIVFQAASYDICHQFLNHQYPDEVDRQLVGADILKDGSTDY
jgi:hypothetical protein